MKTIAVIEDDVPIGNMLSDALTAEGYRVLRAWSGTEALLLLSRETKKPDLILLDLMLPGLSGEELLPKLSGIPVIVISAKSAVDDKVNLLLAGASDYLTKPFSIQELLARITVQLRNAESQAAGSKLYFADLTLDPDSREAAAGNRSVHLTRTEYAILRLLMQNPSQVITKSVLLEKISRDTPDCMESSLKVHISNLRKKLRSISGKDYIEAVWGIGFKLRED